MTTSPSSTTLDSLLKRSHAYDPKRWVQVLVINPHTRGPGLTWLSTFAVVGAISAWILSYFVLFIFGDTAEKGSLYSAFEPEISFIYYSCPRIIIVCSVGLLIAIILRLGGQKFYNWAGQAAVILGLLAVGYAVLWLFVAVLTLIFVVLVLIVGLICVAVSIRFFVLFVIAVFGKLGNVSD